MHKILIADKAFVELRYFSDYEHFVNSADMYREQGYQTRTYPDSEGLQ